MNPRLAAYLGRLGHPEPSAADPAALEALQRAHRQAIPFENFDIALGRPIAIDADSVFAKLVEGGRGGYCFEHNRLLADMLELAGIATRPLLARVWLRAAPGSIPPRTHVVLLTELDGEQWIADAGFGGSYVPVLPLADGAEAETPDGARHRLRRHGHAGAAEGEWIMERAAPAPAGRGEWLAQYSFDLTEVAPVDLAQANLWTSTAPGTRFTSHVIASRPLAGGFASLTDRTLTVARGDGDAERREIGDPAAYAAMLRDVFGIDMREDRLRDWPIFG